MPKKKNTSLSPNPHRRSPSTQVYIQPLAVETLKYPSMAMSVEEMADELGIGRNVAYQLIRLPDFPSFTIGRRVVVDRNGLQEWMKAQYGKEPLILSDEDDNT